MHVLLRDILGYIMRVYEYSSLRVHAAAPFRRVKGHDRRRIIHNNNITYRIIIILGIYYKQQLLLQYYYIYIMLCVCTTTGSAAAEYQSRARLIPRATMIILLYIYPYNIAVLWLIIILNEESHCVQYKLR